MSRTPQDLVGKVVHFHVVAATPTDSRREGFRSGRVYRVQARGGQVQHVRVLLIGQPPKGEAARRGKRRRPVGRAPYQGASLTVLPADLARPCCGVQWYGRIVPLAQWLA